MEVHSGIVSSQRLDLSIHSLPVASFLQKNQHLFVYLVSVSQLKQKTQPYLTGVSFILCVPVCDSGSVIFLIRIFPCEAANRSSKATPHVLCTPLYPHVLQKYPRV